MTTAACDSFLETLNKSGLVEANRLTALLDRLRAAGTLTDDAGKLAASMIREGLLTPFQAEQLLQGRYRGFYISKYRILERLGTGGMGTVYLAEHKFMKRRVALKVLPRTRASDNAALERFYREAKAVAAVDHPNIVRAYDIDQDNDLHFLVMEYVEGISLQEIVRTHGPLDVLQATHYIYQAAKGLHHAHEVGLVHRDIKPANLLVDRNGVVKLLDLGLARFFHDQDDVLTKKYDEKVLGTADYLAPEQALDSHGVDIRADIYSLGGTFYFLLSGKPPFSEGTIAQKLVWHQTRRPTPISELRKDVPREIQTALDKMLAKKPDDRPTTPLEAAKLLEPLIDPLTPPAPPGSSYGRASGLAAEMQDTASAIGSGATTPTSTKAEPVAPSPSSAGRTPLAPAASAGGTSGVRPKQPLQEPTPPPRSGGRQTMERLDVHDGEPARRSGEPRANRPQSALRPQVESTPPATSEESSSVLVLALATAALLLLGLAGWAAYQYLLKDSRDTPATPTQPVPAPGGSWGVGSG